MDHCPKCDGPAPRETLQGMLEVDVAHAGETWEWLWVDDGGVGDWAAGDGVLAASRGGGGGTVCGGSE